MAAELVPITHLETVGHEHGVLPPPAHPNEQVAQAVLTARAVAGAFLRLGREARPQLAWRCESVGAAIDKALHRYFKELDE